MNDRPSWWSSDDELVITQRDNPDAYRCAQCGKIHYGDDERACAIQ